MESIQSIHTLRLTLRPLEPADAASLRVIQKCGLTCVETIHLWGMDLLRHHIERTPTK